MGSQAPVMPDAWMHPLPCPIFGVPPQRGGSFWPRVLGVWRPQGRSPTPSDLCLDAGNGRGLPSALPWEGLLVSSPSLWASSYCPSGNWRRGRGGWGQASLHPLQVLLLPLIPF